ncbi:MAG: dephospho-CoA kinase [Verrucomicrobia bacterium]|nr:MAG: dephospho-CoA kinase [Verrucomicrobiota bacterium]
MITVGLTGGIGMGKSACADLLRQRGIPVIDTDVLARQIVEPGQPALEEIRQTFGPQVIRPDGRLDRKQLAGTVFYDPTARAQLEQILHPRIRQLWKSQLETLRAQTSPTLPLSHSPTPRPAEPRSNAPRSHAPHAPHAPLAVVVIPLLFETHAQTELDATLCVACTSVTQRERLRPRGWSDKEIDLRISAQLPISEKTSLANFVIWTEGSLDVHARQLDRILCSLNSA